LQLTRISKAEGGYNVAFDEKMQIGKEKKKDRKGDNVRKYYEKRR